MSHNVQLITSAKRKADLFAANYAKTSTLKMANADRTKNRMAKERIRQLRDEESTINPFTMEELKTAISKMKAKGAAVPDDISPPLIKHLGPRAVNPFLKLCNLSLKSALAPQLWKNATIIPLLKGNKPHSEMGSFLPISLTPCVGQVLERSRSGYII